MLKQPCVLKNGLLHKQEDEFAVTIFSCRREEQSNEVTKSSLHKHEPIVVRPALKGADNFNGEPQFAHRGVHIDATGLHGGAGEFWMAARVRSGTGVAELTRSRGHSKGFVVPGKEEFSLELCAGSSQILPGLGLPEENGKVVRVKDFACLGRLGTVRGTGEAEVETVASVLALQANPLPGNNFARVKEHKVPYFPREKAGEKLSKAFTVHELSPSSGEGSK